MAENFNRSLAGIGLLSEIKPERMVELEQFARWRRYDAKELVFEGVDSTDLKDALVNVAGDRKGFVNNKNLGIWLARNAGRFEGALRIVRCGTRQGVALWKLERS